MNGFQTTSQDPDTRLKRAYEAERARLAALAASDTPQGDYLHPVFGSGAVDSPVVLIGEAPGKEEAASGKPFIGKAGRELDELLILSGVPRASVYITNAVKYRPVLRGQRTVRNRTPGTPEIREALPLLALELRVIRPRVIVTLGNTPLRAVFALFLAQSKKAPVIGALHGRPFPVELDSLQTEIFPLYHPASGIYNRALVPIMEQDIRALGEHLVNPR